MIGNFKGLCSMWYWAVFCPSRINEAFSLTKKQTTINSLFIFPDTKLLSSYLKLIVVFNIPLIIKIWYSGQIIDFGLLALSLSSSYLLGLFSLPLGLHFSILFLIFYMPSSISGDNPFIPSFLYIRPDSIWLNWLIFLVWWLLVGLLYLSLRNLVIDIISNQKLIIKSMVLSTLIILFIFDIYLFLCLSTSYSLSQVALAVWIISFSSAPSANNMLGVFVIPVIMIILMIYYQGPFWIVPAALIPLGFLRLFPDYILWSCISVFYNLKNDHSIDAVLALPPFANEVLWIPVLAQSQIIKNTFEIAPEQVYFLARESVAWSSFYNPFQVALPRIIYAKIGKPQSIEDLTIFGNAKHPMTQITRLFVSTNAKIPSRWALQIDIELETLLPQIVGISKSVDRLILYPQETENRFRNIITEIENIKTQIIKLDLSRKKQTEWQLFLTRWQEIIKTANSAN